MKFHVEKCNVSVSSVWRKSFFFSLSLFLALKLLEKRNSLIKRVEMIKKLQQTLWPFGVSRNEICKRLLITSTYNQRELNMLAGKCASSASWIHSTNVIKTINKIQSAKDVCSTYFISYSNRNESTLRFHSTTLKRWSNGWTAKLCKRLCANVREFVCVFAELVNTRDEKNRWDNIF